MTQLEAMLLSIAIEAPLALGLMLACAPSWRTPEGALRVLGIAAGATLLTHPMAWWLNTAGLHALLFVPRAAIIEGLVFVAEAALYCFALRVAWTRGALLSGVANGASFGAGLVLWYVGLL